jgi:hypothetical protein
MASVISFNSASAHSLVLNVLGAAGGGTSKTRAEVLAACNAGPLKEKLSREGDWTAFRNGNAKCADIEVREIVNRNAVASGQPASIQFNWTGVGISADATIDAQIQLEIRLPHSSRM